MSNRLWMLVDVVIWGLLFVIWVFVVGMAVLVWG